MARPLPDDVRIVLRENGYEMIGPVAHVYCEGAGPKDEAFYSDKVGSVNISALRRLAEREGSGADIVKLPINTELLAAIEGIEINPKIVRKMSPSRAREPILLVQMPDGLRVIDGHHRIHRRAKDGATEIAAYVFVPEILDAFAVKWFTKGPRGEWVPFDPGISMNSKR